MDYGKEDKGVSGNIPEFGAIFMSNINTKKECLKRRIFASSYSRAEFVTQVKAGMVLFLFEYQKRQLFGVYQATSDGALNILPHAFNYSGQRFPAQVRFRQIWHCHPLPEKEFRDAIRENYFSANQFNFGLSKDQVRRLLYLFNSKKMENRIPLNPQSEASVEVAVKERRWVGGNRRERGYRASDEYDDIDAVAFSDCHVNSLARVKEDDFPQDDFLGKKRRLGIEGRATTDNVAKTELYGHGYGRTFSIDSSKDSLDEVRRLTNSGGLLSAQMENEVQLVQSSDHFLDQLNVRVRDDYAVMQRSTLPDDYNMHNDYQQAFASDHYGDAVGQGKHGISEDRLFLDDCVNRDCNMNPVKSMANISDDSLNLFRQARDRVEPSERLMSRELEHRNHLDSDGSGISAFDPFASLPHKTRNTTAGRFPISENDPDFGTFSVEGFSSRNILRPLQYGYKNNEDRNYRFLEDRSTKDMANKGSSIQSNTAGYIANPNRLTVEGRFGKSERVDNLEVSHTRTNSVTSMKYPSSSQQYRNLSSFSDNLFPEKHSSKLAASCKFGFPHSLFDDATITRDVPYLSEHPNCSHEYSTSIEANQNSTSMQKTSPYGGSLGSLYPSSSDRSQQYILESEKFSRPQDSALEFGNIGFARSTSGFQTSLPQEPINSSENPNLFMDMDLNASAPFNYRGSSASRLSPSHTNLEAFEGGKGSLAYCSKSRDNHFLFHENLPEASEHLNQHVPLRRMALLDDRDFDYSKSEDLSVNICRPETELASYDNQHFRFSSNMNLKELHRTSETNSTFNRRSVFSRLSSKAPSHFVEEGNNADVNHHDNYMDATADEVMEMLQQDKYPSPRKLRKSRVAGQRREGALSEKRPWCNTEFDHSKMEKKKLKNMIQTTGDGVDEIPKETRTLVIQHHSAVNENKVQCHRETIHSIMEKKRMKNASQITADRMDEIHKETRTLDFKRRSDKKNSGGIAADSALQSKPTGANEEVKNSASSTLRRRKLVRPVFGRADTAMDATQGNEKSVIPPLILDKDDKPCYEIGESEIPNAVIGPRNVLVLEACQEMDCNKELVHPQEHKDVVSHVLPSTNVGLKGHVLAGDVVHIGSSNVLKETSQHKSLDIQPFMEGVLAGETSQQNIFDIQTTARGVLAKDTDKNVKGTSHRKSLDIQSSVEVVLAKDKDANIMETSQLESLDIQTTVEGILVKDNDTTMKETSQLKSLDIQTVVEGGLAKDTETSIKGTSQLQSLDIQTSVAGVGTKDTVTTIEETSRYKILDIQTYIEDVSAKTTDTTANETSLHKSSDVQTSFEDILVKDTDITTSGLNPPESSLEEFKLGAGCTNSLSEDNHLKMKIILTTRTDMTTSSQ